MDLNIVNMINGRKGIRLEFNNKHIQLNYIRPLYLKYHKGLLYSLKLWFIYWSKDQIKNIWSDYLFRFLGIQIVLRKYS